MRSRAMVDQLVALTARNAFLKDLPPSTRCGEENARVAGRE
jgi:hypothetical protein